MVARGKTKKEKSVLQRFCAQWELQVMALPAIIFLIIFCYVPIAGNVIAFQDYKILKGIAGSEWVGFKHFKEFWSDDTFWMSLKNTLGLSGYKFLFTYTAPVLFAILLNELPFPKFKKLTQTASYLPHFLSYVIVAGDDSLWPLRRGQS